MKAKRSALRSRRSPVEPWSGRGQMRLFLTVSHTQYFFLEQWYAGKYNDAKESLTAGELLDKNTTADYRHALAQNAALRRARRKK